MLGRGEEALNLCRSFVERYPESPWTADVRFWIGEYHFNLGEWAPAEAAFAALAEAHPKHALADRALYWAGRSAAAAKEPRRALDYYAALARRFPESPLMPEARFAQGDALSEIGEFAAAILAFEELIQQYPNSYLVGAAWGRMGDCHFTLGANDPARFEEALRCYRQARADPGADEWKEQADFKMGRCYERLNRPDEALAQYMNVVYGHLDARARGRAGTALWFTRAAFAAAALQERQNAWREAVAIYRRVEEIGGPAAEDARSRIARIRREQWRLF